MSSAETFGARYVERLSTADRLALESAEDRRAAFAQIDALCDALVVAAMHGERIAEVITHEPASARLTLVSSPDRAELLDSFSVERQQERGAWYIPKSTNFAIGMVHLAHWWKANPRFALSLAGKEFVSGVINSPDAVALWSLLEPMSALLAAPLMLRAGYWGHQRDPKDADRKLSRWEPLVRPLYEAAAVADDAIGLFAPGTGWDRLDADEVLARRDALLSAWSRADVDVAARLRTFQIGRLVERYYAIAKDGRALRRRVVTNDFQSLLSAYFGGDWLALLAYLGEEPHPAEEVIRTLPEARVLAVSSARVDEVATTEGIDADEIQRMLSAYWGQSPGRTPIEERVDTLKRFWVEFDALHAQQAPGMQSLEYLMASDTRPKALEDRLLSAPLLEDLRRLWATKVLPKWPDRLVSEPFWAEAAMHAFGHAIYSWRELALTAWNMCEGGRAYAGLSAFETYSSQRFPGLSETGFVVDAAMFVELRAAEAKLGPRRDETTVEIQIIGTGDRVSHSKATRGGFEALRDIITRHRRAWAAQHLDAYLERRWRDELGQVAEGYHRRVADKGKPPTVKQFLQMAKEPVANWFAGDVTDVYGALGFKSPIKSPTYERVLPTNWRDFYGSVRKQLRDVAIAQLADYDTRTDTERAFQDAMSRMSPGWQEMRAELGRAPTPKEYSASYEWGRLVRQSLTWMSLREALGRAPTLAEFGATRFSGDAKVLAADIDDAWLIYSTAIERALAPEPEAEPAAAARANDSAPAALKPDVVAEGVPQDGVQHAELEAVRTLPHARGLRNLFRRAQ